MDEFISANGFWLWLPLISISAQACSVEDILQMLLIQKGLGYAGSVCVCVCCSDETDVGHGAPARLAQTLHLCTCVQTDFHQEQSGQKRCSHKRTISHLLGTLVSLSMVHSVVFCFLTPLAWECSKLFLS